MLLISSFGLALQTVQTDKHKLQAAYDMQAGITDKSYIWQRYWFYGNSQQTAENVKVLLNHANIFAETQALLREITQIGLKQAKTM